jgi:hypothetical protein
MVNSASFLGFGPTPRVCGRGQVGTENLSLGQRHIWLDPEHLGNYPFTFYFQCDPCFHAH